MRYAIVDLAMLQIPRCRWRKGQQVLYPSANGQLIVGHIYHVSSSVRTNPNIYRKYRLHLVENEEGYKEQVLEDDLILFDAGRLLLCERSEVTKRTRLSLT